MDALDYNSDDEVSSEGEGARPEEKDGGKSGQPVGTPAPVEKREPSERKRLKAEDGRPAAGPPPPPLSPPRRKVSDDASVTMRAAGEASGASGEGRADDRPRAGLIPVQLLTRRPNVPTEDLSALGMRTGKK